MREIEEKYSNFDGMMSEVPNDMPWGDTQWSSASGRPFTPPPSGRSVMGDPFPTALSPANRTGEYNPDVPITNSVYNEEERYTSPNIVASPIYYSPNDGRSAGDWNPTISIDSRTAGPIRPISIVGDGQYVDWRPPIQPATRGFSGGNNLVLADNDNSTMPDSDVWSNHPGFLGGSWWKDFWFPGKAEQERAAKAREAIDSKYPITGSCDILTATEGSINASLEQHSKATKRGPKRVAKRTIPILKNKLKTVTSNRQVQCDSEEQDQLQDDKLDMFMQQQMQQPESKEGMSATNIVLGLVIIGGLIWGVSRLSKSGAPVVAPRPSAPTT